MNEKIQKFWTDLDQNFVINKRELFLGITTCTLAGILLGILISPKKAKTVTIASHNGNTVHNGSIPENTDCPEVNPEVLTDDTEGA